MKSIIRKHRIAAFIISFALAMATGAAAAIIIYDLTATGTAPNNAITLTTTHTGALTYSGNGVAPALDANSTSVVPVKLANNDPLVAHTVGGGLTATITDPTTPSCATHLSVAALSASLTNGSVVPAAGSVTGTVTVSADSTIPLSCSGTTYTITFTGIASA
jgi:hypothetical protein